MKSSTPRLPTKTAQQKIYTNGNVLAPFVIIILLQLIIMMICGMAIGRLNESKELLLANRRIVMEIATQKDVRTKKLEDALERVQYKLQSLDAKTEALEDAKAPR